MGQVPRYGIVGSGRVARHLAHYLSLLGIPCEGSPDFRTPVVLLAVSDHAIDAVARDFGKHEDQTLVHFSGSHVSQKAVCFHPLMTFGEELYDLTTYQSIPFIGDVGGPGFKIVFPGLNNPNYEIPTSQRALYHSLCVLSGNFTVLLWQKFYASLEQDFGIPKKAAQPYLERITKNLLENPEAALTGPLQRGDAHTIENNLRALEGDPYQEVYRAFVKAVKI